MTTIPAYRVLPWLFLRAPYFSYAAYDLRRMPVVLSDTAFRDAIYLASPSFYEIVSLKNFDWLQLSAKERHTLCKYYNRMCFRPTPFGSFSTYTLLGWGGEEGVELSRNDHVLLHLQPDEQLRVRTEYPDNDEAFIIINPLLYRVGKEYRFTRTADDGTGKNLFFLDSLEADTFYTRLFKLFTKGPVALKNVRAAVMRYGLCTPEEATGHLQFLFKQQILYSPGQGGIIGGEFAAAGHPDFWAKTGTVKSGERPTLQALGADLQNKWLQPGKFPDQKFFYAAAERPLMNGGASPDDREAIEQALTVLQQLSSYRALPALQQFTEAFKARFDLEKVPLLLALDPDAGIAYHRVTSASGNAGAADDLRLPASEEGETVIAWTAVQRFLLSCWKRAGTDPYAPIEINSEMLAGTGLGMDNKSHFPNTSSILFRPCGNKLLMEPSGGPSGTALIGRFSVFSEETASVSREIAALECAANPDILFADIGQFSNNHVDNINRRKQIYPYEIPLNVFSSYPAAMQLRPEDLLLSVQNGELVMESSGKCKRVIPRLASAYNYLNNELGIFRFLCDLQYQGLNTGFSLDLESLFPGMGFYPRVCTGKVVLSPAKWKFTKMELSVLFEDGPSGSLAGLEQFRQKYHLPAWVSLGHFDQQLVFNLSDRSEAVFFLECAKGMQQMTLLEYLLPGREIRAGHRPLAGQLLCFIHHERAVYRSLSVRSPKIQVRVTREFPPGSNWLYLKIYCTPLTADRILADVLRPVLQEFEKIIDSWFFVRYTDPGYHIRLRFRVKSADGGAVLAGICREMRKTGHERLIHNLQGDTYKRELERYGPALITHAENVFWRGSELVLSGLAGAESVGQHGEFLPAFSTALHMTLTMMDMEDAVTFSAQVADQFLAEFKADKVSKISLDAKFRSMQTALSAAIGTPGRNGMLSKLLTAVQRLKLAALSQTGTDLQQLTVNLVHMQLNRTFQTDQRKQELLVWYCLSKYLRSLKARKIKG